MFTFAAEIWERGRLAGIPQDKESTYVKEYRGPARRPRSMTLDTLADVMRSGRQGEVVERITARDDDDCRCCEALAWEPTSYRLPATRYVELSLQS